MSPTKQKNMGTAKSKVHLSGWPYIMVGIISMMMASSLIILSG